MRSDLRAADPPSKFTVELIDQLVRGNASFVKAERKRSVKVVTIDPNSTPTEAGEPVGKSEPASPLFKGLLSSMRDGSIERLAFESDPAYTNTYASVFKSKMKLIPDTILKRIAIQDDLVASIVNTRAMQIQVFGRPAPDRFSTGFKLDVDEELVSKLTEEERTDVERRKARFQKLLLTCGHTRGWSDREKLTFPQFLGMTARNAVVVGRIAVEVIHVEEGGERVPHSFRPIDAGTIYRAAPCKEAAQSIRDEAVHLLEALKNKKLRPEKFQNDEYAWVQVMDGKPVQAFTEEECLVHNFYPVADVELDGYPVTPIDTAIAAVTTHINITTHNRMFFQTGRAAKGFLTFKSEDEIGDDTIAMVKQQFMASVNNVSNSWRLPVFSIGANDEITFTPFESQNDMEFQYLSDSNARVIMSAFQISPEELPGYQHLSRGTNSQALSECFDPSSYLWTDAGLVRADEFLGDARERRFRVWTGTEWQEARVFRTGEKRLAETHVDGLSLRTSPDHRFRVLTEGGELVWRRQEELKLGDLLAVNARQVAGDEASVPGFRGKKLTPAVCEVLGWMLGDGSLVAPKARAGGYLKLFYHHEKEREVWASQCAVLREFGLEVEHHERAVTPEEVEEVKARYGFESVAATRITNVVHDTEFVEWLRALGFGYSHEGKSLAPLFHVLPVEYRQAFLRGLFSADGHVPETGQVVLTIQDEAAREQVRQMLLGLGIRTLGCKGLWRAGVKKVVSFSHKLFIKDRELFWQQVGFLQPHKVARRKPQQWSHGTVPPALAAKLLAPVLESEVYKSWKKSEKDNVRSVAMTSSTDRKSVRTMTWDRMRSVLERALGSAPSWMADFYFEPVKDLIIHELGIPMVDVEVFDFRHAQILQGFQVHNSNNEYKLEASRDVGIRPLKSQFEDFMNERILPLFDPVLAKYCTIKFVGLDAETPEKEATRLSEDVQIHMTYDEVLRKVEKEPVGIDIGGSLPLNPQYNERLDALFTVGQILERYCGVKDASKDPSLAYRRDPFFFQWVQLQAAQQQAQVAQPPPSGGSSQQPNQGQPVQQPPEAESPDLTTGIEQAIGSLTKSEKAEGRLPPSRRRLLELHRELVDRSVASMEDDLRAATEKLFKVAGKYVPKA